MGAFAYLTDNKGAFFCVQDSPAMVVAVVLHAGEYYTISVSASAKKAKRLLDLSFIFMPCSKSEFDEKFAIAQRQITAIRQLLNT